jgi:hypothetical protein
VQPNQLPLFPLGTVLFPGGLLPLRIFEPRYLDLVRDCARHGSGFGVCLILDGLEVAEPATPLAGRVPRATEGRARPLPAALGCEARIVDFSTTTDGLLGIVAQGGRRFHVERTRVRDNGLIVADVSWLPEAVPARIRPEHQLLSILLARILERADEAFDKAGLEDADWVAWRLAEWLPMPMSDRQVLLQEIDPHRRLQRLVERLPDFQSD